MVEAVMSDEEKRSGLIPMLQRVQAERGYLSEESIREIGEAIGMSPNRVFGVATFYAQFRFVPQGKHMCRVCMGTACHVRGAERVLEAISLRLGIEDGETTPDLEYSLETVACLGACSLAPAIVIDEEVHGQMTAKKVAEVLGGSTEE